ncbi:MAG: glutamate synthase subunit beta [Desulfobacterales bacterium]|nr:MAG: glutamate synthase subunit beta [Desulfobacterales bacterium]
MGKPTGFKEYDRELPVKRPVKERIKDFKEIYLPFPRAKLKMQAARCMDCGVPTCHAGCPLGNLIPDWNDFVYQDSWQYALGQLLLTNSFPEFTGRLCPAPCEEACVLGINEPPVTIEQIEKEIIEHAFQQGWIKPEPPEKRTGKTVAVIGSGPSGLACAQQLNRAGHRVTVYERADRIGGLLRYGIPDFKLEKWVLDRRLDLMQQEGIRFEARVNVGVDLMPEDLNGFDAAVICTGATIPGDLPIPGRNLKGVHFAMDFLSRQNRSIAGDSLARLKIDLISAVGKHVVVIGGGDTGSDCIGTCIRQQAKSVTNFEIFPKPPEHRSESHPWPFWPVKMRTSTSHEEGCLRQWGILTKSFIGEAGKIVKLKTVDVEFVIDGQGRTEMREIAGSEREWPADLVLLALGFTGPEPNTIVTGCNLDLDERGNIQTDQNYMTNKPGIFAAGDAHRGQSLIVWAISEGREAARCVDAYLMGASALPTKGGGDLPRI